MPGSNAPVQLAQLPRADDDAFRAFVRFPSGWSRPAAGHYAAAEEFLILEGELQLNDTTWRVGGYAWIPARRVRSGSRSESGGLAFAWFAGVPRWIAGEPSQPPSSPVVSFARWHDAPEGKLYSGPEHQTWIVERRQIASLGITGKHCETLGLRSRAWRMDATHEDDPAEPVLLRVW
jgi:hypothetical protein